MFGDDFYIELQMPGVEGEKEVFEQLVVIANHFKIKMIVANDCHYIQREDFTMQKVMMAIDQQLPVDSPDLFHVNSNEQYFKTRHELRASFKLRGFDKFATDDDFERACDNTLEIAEKCKVFKPDLGPKLPSLGDAESELRRLAEEGLRTKGLDKDETRFMIDNREVSYKEQMEIELERFIEKGFASYFLITRDLVMQSKSKGWPLGPARGSAGGSLVCYLLDIHELNPRKWKLSFNRFLSPSRGGKMLKITME
jgi:DNA polymerase-3 subunit alpha